LEANDDPFLQAATFTDDTTNPFDLSADKVSLKKNVLPLELMQHTLCFCDFRTLLKVAQVNRTWNEASDSAKVWKSLCKSKYGSDNLKENKAYCKHLGWKMIHFVGVCKTVLVNTPEKYAIALVPYAGLTLRDVFTSIGIDKPHHYRVTSPNFSEFITNEIDDVDPEGEEGCWPSLLKYPVCEILVEPFSTIYITSIRRGERTPKRKDSLPDEEDDDDDPATKATRDAKGKSLEEQTKLAWKSRAICKLQQMPKFIWNGMQAQWASLLSTPRSKITRAADITATTTTTPSTTAAPTKRSTISVTHVSGRPPSAGVAPAAKAPSATHRR
jgi:hypothetical protein